MGFADAVKEVLGFGKLTKEQRLPLVKCSLLHLQKLCGVVKVRSPSPFGRMEPLSHAASNLAMEISR